MKKYRSTADAQHDKDHKLAHPRPRHEKTAEDRLPAEQRKRGGKR